MKISDTPFSTLPFSPLFTDYLSEQTSIRDFFEYLPFEKSELQRRAEEISFHNEREKVSEELTAFNHHYGAGSETLASIERLKNPDALTVVTGQQVILFGGPLFTIYKILTTILWAEKMETLCSRPVIPVFWMADEDHDFEEAASIGLFEGQSLKKIQLQKEGDHSRRVSDTMLGESFETFSRDVRSLLYDTDFRNEVLTLLNETYKQTSAIGDGFGKLILSLFGKYGLVLAGSNSKELKQLMKVPLKRSVEKQAEIYSDLKQTSQDLTEAGYHSQVQIQPSNLFYIDENKNRLRIQIESGEWRVADSEIRWSRDELIGQIEKEPDRFSPNVFLRPLVQNYILPAAVYVAGPGEVAYYAQMKRVYSRFDLKMPLILPRFSITLRENAIQKQMDELPFDLHSYSKRIEDLESDYLSKSDTPDIETLFSGWKEEVESASHPYSLRVAEIDPTLEAASAKVVTQFQNELDKLKGKVYRSLKESEKVNIKRIHRIQSQLFPLRSLQEREVASVWYMNKYGIGVWDRIFSLLRDELPDTHKLIDL